MISSSDILHAKVLIVEKEEVSALLLERLLRGAGYLSITSTTDPGEVCGLHRKNGYDLILLDEDTVARLGVDGFVIALRHVSGPDYAATAALKVIEAVSQPYVLEGQTVNVTTSVGVGIYPINRKDADTLMKSADLALYEAKHAGTNAYRMAERTDLSTQTRSPNKSRLLAKRMTPVVFVPSLALLWFCCRVAQLLINAASSTGRCNTS